MTIADAFETLKGLLPPDGTRKCGGCTLCCHLTPVKELNKPGWKRCHHQVINRGCAIYPDRPLSCRLWSCAWLCGEDTDGLVRPDKSHYVIDIIPDYIRVNEPGQPSQVLQVVQVWAHPAYPNAHRDPALRAWLLARKLCGLVRLSEFEALVLMLPTMTVEHTWREVVSNCAGPPGSIQPKEPTP